MNELLDFTKPIDEAITDLADLQEQSVVASGLAPASIDDPRLGTPPYDDIPCCIYFYYVRVNSNGRVFVSHHFYPGGDPNDQHNPPSPTDWDTIYRDPLALTKILEELAHDARPSGPGVYPPLGSGGFQNVEWRRKSYIAFFIDEANWTLKPTNGVIFVTNKGGVPGTPNHTFFDALSLSLTMRIDNPRPGSPTIDQRSALIFVNHMKRDAAGNDLVLGDNQLFHFQMVFDVAIEGSPNRMTVIFDPDGNNLGPPLPPP